MDYYSVDEEMLELKGIFTEGIIKKFGIPFEKVTEHGMVYLNCSNVTLYEVPPPYDNVTVFYEFWNRYALKYSVPKYYFGEDEIEKYELTPVGKNELPTIICTWDVRMFENGKIKEKK
jgi:hypothetical protein